MNITRMSEAMPAWTKILLSGLLTVVMEAIVYLLNIPNPNLILFVVLNICLVFGGYGSGSMSGALTILYSIFFFSTGHDWHTFTTVNAEKIVVAVICVVIDILLVGHMYHSLEKSMEEKTRFLERDLETDELTLVRNRRGLAKAQPDFLNRDIFVVMVDIDRFKDFNDEDGHEAGDQVLKKTAAVLATWYGHSCCFRYGGDEFLIVSPFTSVEDILLKDEKARRSLNDISEGTSSHSITISAGAAYGTPETAGQLHEMVKSADKQLYKAKESGRNRLNISDSTQAL